MSLGGSVKASRLEVEAIAPIHPVRSPWIVRVEGKWGSYASPDNKITSDKIAHVPDPRFGAYLVGDKGITELKTSKT
jgi:hypothetical protein